MVSTRTRRWIHRPGFASYGTVTRVLRASSINKLTIQKSQIVCIGICHCPGCSLFTVSYFLFHYLKHYCFISNCVDFLYKLQEIILMSWQILSLTIWIVKSLIAGPLILISSSTPPSAKKDCQSISFSLSMHITTARAIPLVPHRLCRTSVLHQPPIRKITSLCLIWQVLEPITLPI